MWVAYALLQLPTTTGVHKTNALCGLLMYISYAYLFIVFYLRNYVKGVHPMMTVLVGTTHVAAIVGLKLLWNHYQRVRLAVEVGVGYVLTVILLQNFTLQLRSLVKNSQAVSSETNLPSDELVTGRFTRLSLMLVNPWIVWAYENQQLQQSYNLILSKRECDLDPAAKGVHCKKFDTQNFVKDLMTDTSSIQDVVTRTAPYPSRSAICVLGSRVKSRFKADLVLLAISMIIPTMYGRVFHQNALLGLLIHCCLRWCIELYTIQNEKFNPPSNLDPIKD